MRLHTRATPPSPTLIRLLLLLLLLLLLQRQPCCCMQDSPNAAPLGFTAVCQEAAAARRARLPLRVLRPPGARVPDSGTRTQERERLIPERRATCMALQVSQAAPPPLPPIPPPSPKRLVRQPSKCLRRWRRGPDRPARLASIGDSAASGCCGCTCGMPCQGPQPPTCPAPSVQQLRLLTEAKSATTFRPSGAC